MKLLFSILLLLSTFLIINAENQATGKPLIEIVEGLIYQTDDRKYYRAFIINNTEQLEFHNVTINCLGCFSKEDSDVFEVSPPLVANDDGTFTLPVLYKKSHETFAYNGPYSAQWYIVSSN